MMRSRDKLEELRLWSGGCRCMCTGCDLLEPERNPSVTVECVN